jgi:hypothetical protein
MAGNKNQHFVPRVYLRSFTDGDCGKTINLYNLDRASAITGAAVKGQCAGDYFYGADLVIERWLQQIEGAYGSLLKRVIVPSYQITADDAHALRRFWFVQYLRTSAAAQRLVLMMDQMDVDVGGLPEAYRLDIKEAVQFAMRTANSEAKTVDDLEVRLLRNRTKIPFITSDNPAVMTNRWHLVDRRADRQAPGVQNAGMIGMLPLTPEIMCLVYDGGLHAIPHVDGWAILERASDVQAYNAHQVMNCEANLYFKVWDDRTQVAALTAVNSPLRPVSRYRITHAIPDGQVEGGRRFRVVSSEEARDHDGSMIHSESVLPVPTAWPSQLSWRAGAAVYDSGTAVGFVRRAGQERGYRKIVIRR